MKRAAAVVTVAALLTFAGLNLLASFSSVQTPRERLIVTALQPPAPPPGTSSTNKPSRPSVPPTVATRSFVVRTNATIVRMNAISSALSPPACQSARLRRVLALECGESAERAAHDAASDSAKLQAALRTWQHPTECTVARTRVYRDWRNGLGAQLSSLVGAWAAALAKDDLARVNARATVLLAAGGMRYANKALCPSRDLTCYFEPLSSCDAPSRTTGVKEARAAKTPAALAVRLSDQLGLSRTRDKWWLRMELTRYIFRPNAATLGMLAAVREEMRLRAPSGDDSALRPASAVQEGAEAASEADERRTDELVALHVRRGDKRDLGAKERGEPFSDSMYVAAAAAVAEASGARGFLLASSEPSTLSRLPPLLRAATGLPTYVMPAHHFVQVPEGKTPHQVVETTRQEGAGRDEGRSQLVQLMLLAECRAFVGTVTSNFGQLVTKLMAFRQPTPASLDLSCAGLAPMQNASAGETWPLRWEKADGRRCRSSSSRKV